MTKDKDFYPLPPPKKREKREKEYDECWITHPDNEKVEINTKDGKLRSKAFNPYEYIELEAQQGQ